MQKVINRYRERLKEFGIGPAAIETPKNRQSLRYSIFTKAIKEDGFSLLDFGCGFGYLYEFLKEKYNNFEYTGADIVSEFIDHNKQKFPENNFILLKNSPYDIKETYDYIIIAGPFAVIYGDSEKEHFEYIKSTLKYLLENTNICMVLDFMHDKVDFKQEDAYHQNVMEFYRFVKEELSPRCIIDESYMPYEFAVTIYKDNRILRPQNTYRD